MLQVFAYIAFGVLAIILILLVIAALPLWSKETPTDAASTIGRFLLGNLSASEWDAFTSVRAKDPLVQRAKQRILEIERQHSCDEPPTFLNAAGHAALHQVAASLRSAAA